MRIAVGQIHQESNTFTPIKTTMQEFHRMGILEGKEILDQYLAGELEGCVNGFIPVLERAGAEIVPLIRYDARPVHYGIVAQETFEKIEEHLTSSLERALPLDGVLINMHGAMVAEEIEDAEGHLIETSRKVIGSQTPLVVTFDPHAFITRKKVENALVVGYKTYPHTDQIETGEKAAQLLLNMITRGFRLEVGFVRLPMIIAATSTTTEAGAFKELVELANRSEEDKDVLRSNIFPCQPWLDIREVGWGVTVYGFDKMKAEEWARRIARESWTRKEEFRLENTPLYPFLSPAEAVRVAASHRGKPVVVTDTGDLVPGDSTILLGEMLKQEIDCEAMITMLDPEAAEICAKAGVGNKVRLRLGGKRETLFSKPLEVEGKVRALFDGQYNPRGDSGLTAVLQIRHVKVLVTTLLGGNYRSFGLEPEKAQIWVSKAARGHLTPDLRRLASKIVFAGVPGYAMSDVKQLPFEKLPRPFYPFDEEEDEYAELRKQLHID